MNLYVAFAIMLIASAVVSWWVLKESRNEINKMGKGRKLTLEEQLK